jgi:hypothetical protein
MKKISKTYLWWIENKDGASQGEFKSLQEAKNAIKEGIESGWLSEEGEWKPIKHEAEPCPTCGRPTPKVIIRGVGECLRCDHVRGDL